MSASRLNNAIAALEFRNMGDPVVVKLQRDWSSWYADVRPWLPVKVEWVALEWFWQRYRSAYNAAAVKGGDAVDPSTVDPNLADMIKRDLAWRADAIQATAKATGQAVSDIATAASDSLQQAATNLRPTLLPIGIAVGGLAALALYMKSRPIVIAANAVRGRPNQ